MSGLLDKVKDAVSKSGSSSTTTGNTAGAGTTTGTSGAAGSEDYGDKGLDFLEKKTGHSLSREQNEKITDGARGLYEKQTGNSVSNKFSN